MTMRPVRLGSTLVAHVVAMAAIAVLSAAPPTPPPLDASAVDPAARAAAQETFVSAAAGKAGDRPKVAARDVGVGPRRHPDWRRDPAQVPDDLAAAARPEHYVYGGAPVATPVDTTRLLVQLAPGAPGALEAAWEVGVPAASSRAVGFGRWHVLDLEPGAAAGDADDAAAVEAHLDALGTTLDVAFASPAFRTPAMDDGWFAVSSDIFARVQPEHLANADAVVAAAAPELVVVERDVAGLPGAFRLRSAAADGFTVLHIANRLARDARFAWSEPEMIGTMDLGEVPNDPDFDMCWGLENTEQWGCCAGTDLGAVEAWDVSNGDYPVRVLVLDVGIDQDHEDINQLTGRDFTDGEADGFGDGDPTGPCDRHGTSVAGIIAARMNNGIGTVGIAGDSYVVSARIAQEQSNPCSSAYAMYSSAFLANAINWGYGQGCLITNASLKVGASSLVEDAYDDTWFNGMLHFAATGNDSENDIKFPAELGAVIAVGSIDPDGDLSSFSNYGTGMGFVTPGRDIWTTDRTGAPGYNGGEYVYFSGTSAASPFAAGVAALIWSALPDYSSVAIEFWMQQGCVDLGAPGYDTTYGWGLPQPRASLNGPGPFNNFCANSWPILTPVFSPAPFDTTLATAFSDEPQEWCEWNDAGVSNSVWFAFYAPCDAVVDINTNGSSYDTVLSLWVGDCTFAWPVACDDDSGTGLDSQLTDVSVGGGNIYMIKVADYDTAPGGGSLDFDFVFRQPNDECLDATVIDAGSTGFCTLGATNSGTQPSCDVGTMVGDVWFVHTATQTGTLTARTCGYDGFDTKLAAYEELNQSHCPAILGAQLIGCSDDAAGACTAVSSALTIDVVAGRDYTFRVGGHVGEPAGEGSLTLTYATCAGDATGDGIVGFADLLAVLAAWGTADAAADVNDDGIVNFSDLLDVLAAWGACP